MLFVILVLTRSFLLFAYVAILIAFFIPFQKYSYKHRDFYLLKNCYVFNYSLAGSMIIILAGNLIFPVIAIQQTK